MVATIALERLSGKLFTRGGLLIFLTILFANLSFNVLNDIVDYDSDRIIKPWKPLPSGIIFPNTALKVSIILGLAALFTLLLLGSPIYLLLGIAGIIAGFIYNVLHDRGVIGNIALGISYFVCAYMASYPKFLGFAIGFALLVVGYNIAVQLQDLEGDMRAGWVTLPMQVDTAVAASLSSGIAMMGGEVIIDSIVPGKWCFFAAAMLVVAAVVIDRDRWYEVLLRKGARLLIILGFTVAALSGHWGIPAIG